MGLDFVIPSKVEVLAKEYSLNSDYNEMAFEVQYWNTHQKKKDWIY